MANPFSGDSNLPFRKPPATPITLTAYAETFGRGAEVESQSSSGSDADSIQKRMELVEVNTSIKLEDGARLTTGLSQATTAPGAIPAGSSREEIREGGFSLQQQNSQRSIPYEPFWSMIRRREPQKSFKPVQSPHRDHSPKRQQQDKLEVLRQRILKEQSHLEATKQQLEEERRMHEMYIDQQRDLLKEEIQQVEKRKQSLLIRQMLLERNCVAHSKRNREAGRHRIELFCYKLTHALKLREQEISMKYHFFHLLACQTQRSKPQLSQHGKKKTLAKVKSCQQIVPIVGRSLSPKAFEVASGGRSSIVLQPTKSKLMKKASKVDLRSQIRRPRNKSTEQVARPPQHKPIRPKPKKQLKCTRSNILQPVRSPNKPC